MLDAVLLLRPSRDVPGVRARLCRIEGQACALRRMYEGGRSAEDLVDQIAALRGSLLGLGLVIAGHEISERVAGEPHPESSRTARAAETSRLLQRLVRP